MRKTIKVPKSKTPKIVSQIGDRSDISPPDIASVELATLSGNVINVPNKGIYLLINHICLFFVRLLKSF